MATKHFKKGVGRKSQENLLKIRIMKTCTIGEREKKLENQSKYWEFQKDMTEKTVVRKLKLWFKKIAQIEENISNLKEPIAWAQCPTYTKYTSMKFQNVDNLQKTYKEHPAGGNIRWCNHSGKQFESFFRIHTHTYHIMKKFHF